MSGDTRGRVVGGITGSLPLVPSVFVYATVWGGLARQAGLSLGEIAFMCLIVTAGASQFVAVPGSSPLTFHLLIP